MSDSSSYVLALRGSSIDILENAALEAGITSFESSLDVEPPWIKIYGDNLPALEALRARFVNRFGTLVEASLSLISDEWKTRFQEFLRPERVSETLTVRPTHFAYAPRSATERVTVIDPGLAFGSGSHPSTKLVLRSLERELRHRPESTVLDVGCGTGVLCIAASLLGAARVIGIDLDPEAIRVAGGNALKNGDTVSRFLLTPLSAISTNETFDIICINIISSVVRELWSELLQRATPGTRILVAGFLRGEEKDLLDALIDSTLEVESRSEEDEWCHVTLLKRA